MHTINIEVALPKFSFTSEFVLNDPLIGMGMSDAFGPKADFSGIAPSLSISLVKHKAFIEVNEQGSEAASTAVVMTKSMPPQFVANKPFLILVRYNQSGSILFLESVSNPTKQ